MTLMSLGIFYVVLVCKGKGWDGNLRICKDSFTRSLVSIEWH